MKESYNLHELQIVRLGRARTDLLWWFDQKITPYRNKIHQTNSEPDRDKRCRLKAQAYRDYNSNPEVVAIWQEFERRQKE